jgi:diguanylate cyclase (GGDEF)-like protein/PAS domain S-box-containing protein
MKTKFPLNRKVQLAFGSAILALLVVGALSYRAVVLSSESDRWLGHSHEVLANLHDLDFAMETVESSTRGFVLTGNESYLETYRASRLIAAQEEEIVRSLTADNPKQQNRLPALEKLTAEQFALAELVVSRRRAQGLEAAADVIRSGSSQRIMIDFLATGNKMQGDELRLLVLRKADAKRRLTQTKIVLLFGLVLGFLITGAAGWSVHSDSSDRKQAKSKLLLLTERLSLATAVAKVGVWEWDSNSNSMTWDAAMFEIYGLPPTVPMPYDKWSAAVHPEDLPSVEARFEKVIAEKSQGYEEFRIIRTDGSLRNLSAVEGVVLDEYAKVNRVIGVNVDITERKAAERHLAQMEDRYRGLLEAAPDAMVVVNPGGDIVLLNVQAEKTFGYRRDELVGQKVKNIIPEGFAERLVADALRSTEDALAQQIDTGIEITGRRKNGSEFPIEIMLSPLEGAEGILVTAAIRDITTRKKADAQMIHSAEHDFLTGLPNRLLLNDRVGQAILLARRHGNKVAVLFLDLDGFKHINDSLGHTIGDNLLQSVAKRLLSCVRASDTVSRQGGDEFVVLLSEVEKTEDAAIAARRMLQAVAEAHAIDQHDLHVTTSIGVSVYPDDGLDAETLIKDADTAMYQAKEDRRQSYQFFTPAMNVRAVERQSIEESLGRALERQEFELHYQPKINLRTGKITGAEALIRWTHPTRGRVSPAQFIPAAEDCGLILPIGNWALCEACRQARAWLDAGLPLATIAVNISAIEFRNENFLEGVFAVLKDTGLDPRCLELELTESVLMKHAEATESILKALRSRGVQLAVDDFGTGYSSLSYLRRFSVDTLKIDQSFIRQITTTPHETTIVTAIISMGRSLKLRVVAEGVETQEELAFLQTHRCDEAQGYYFSRPVLPEQFAKLLETGIALPVHETSLAMEHAGVSQHPYVTDRLRFISHEGKQILLIDVSNCSPAEVETMFRAVPELVTTRPRGSVLILTDFNGASFDQEAIRVMKETAVFDKPYVKKSAWAGTENLPHVFSTNLSSFSRREFPIFKTREEALVWLAKD